MTTMNQIKFIYCFTDKEVSNLLSTGTCKACPEKQKKDCKGNVNN